MPDIREEIAALKREHDTVILAHTYQPGEVQDCADYVGDSYGLSVEASHTAASVIIFCGVRFMAETAAILNPSRTVILPEPLAGCPMADMITTHILARFRMVGLSSMAGYLSIADANAVTLELGKRDIIPVIQNTPVMAGLLGADPGPGRGRGSAR